MARRKMRLILDTDIDTDCDDAGALAVLHALAAKNEVIPLGIICCVPVIDCASCVQAINASFGLDDIPVGLMKIPQWENDPRFSAYRRHRQLSDARIYNGSIGRQWRMANPDAAVEDGVKLYRRLLASQPDGSVTICAIGTMTALAELIRSKPDDISPLNGMDLISLKTDKLVTMALGSFPSGRDPFNWAKDLPAAAAVLENWPVPIVVSETGKDVQTGAKFMQAASSDHPVRRAYEIFLGPDNRNRSSWDQLAVLYAVRGCRGFFEERTGYALKFDLQTGRHVWEQRSADDSRHVSLIQVASPATLADEVEALMIDALNIPH